MDYNLAVCYICRGLMSYRQVREAVYWLPDMDEFELGWARWEGFVFNFAHRHCWKRLKEKKRQLIRLCALKRHEPQSLGQLV